MSSYTPSMISHLQSLDVIDLTVCRALANDWPVSHQSIISKVKSLGLEYTKQEKIATAKKAGATKADTLKEIESALDCKLTGLEKATSASLGKLLEIVSIGKAQDASPLPASIMGATLD
jgi:hypothetical protein